MTLTALSHQSTIEAPVPNDPKKLREGKAMEVRTWHTDHRTYLGCSTEEKNQPDWYAQADASPYNSWTSEGIGKDAIKE